MSETKLIVFLEEMEQAAKELQGRLVERDTEGIWKALSRQEKVVESLSRISPQEAQELAGLSKRNNHVGGLLDRSRSLLRTNRALSRTFLHVIDRTLAQLGGVDSSPYSGYGPAVATNRSLLVNQQV